MIHRQHIILAVTAALGIIIGFAAAFVLQKFILQPEIVPSEITENGSEEAPPQISEKPLLPQQIIEQNRSIHEIKQEGDVVFVEVRSPHKSEWLEGTLAELWRIDADGSAEILHSAIFNKCGDFDWNIEASIVTVTEMGSPCEAFRHYTQTLYSFFGGEELFTSSWGTADTQFTFEIPHERRTDLKATLRLEYDQACKGSNLAVPTIPKTTLIGVFVEQGYSNPTTSFVALTEPVTVECEVGYGENLIYPTIGQPSLEGTIDGVVIRFELPGDWIGVFDPTAPAGSELTFERS